MQLAAQTHSWLLLQDEFPETYRFTASTFPSEDDDVVTSPYNAMLSLAELTQHADAVLPLENQALLDICSLLDSKLKPTVKPGSLATGPEAGAVQSEPYAEVLGAVGSMSTFGAASQAGGAGGWGPAMQMGWPGRGLRGMQ